MADPNARQTSVLIMERERHICRMVASMLRTMGIGRVMETATPDQAMDRLRHMPVDLILAGAGIERGVPYRFIRKLRTERDLDICVPLIVFGTGVRRADITDAHENGIDLILLQPFSQHDLKERVQQLLFQKRYCTFCRKNKLPFDCMGKENLGVRAPTGIEAHV